MIVLYYFEGFKSREVADLLDLKESTVRVRLSRVLPLNVSRRSGTATLTAQKIEIAPSLSSITYSLVQPGSSKEKINAGELTINLYDENGNAIQGPGMSAPDVSELCDLEVQTFVVHYYTGTRQPKALYAMPSWVKSNDPYTVGPNDLRTTKPLNEAELPFVIRNGNDTLTIAKVDRREDRTLVYWTIDTPDQPFASLSYRDQGLRLERKNGDLLGMIGSVPNREAGENAYISVFSPMEPSESVNVRVLTGNFQRNDWNMKLPLEKKPSLKRGLFFLHALMK